MEVRELDQREYDQKLRTVIVGTEGLHAHVQDVGDGMATIGWGYTLNRNNNVEIWARAGLELSPEQRAMLERVDRAPRAEKTRIGLRFDKVLTEAESDMLFRASLVEYEGPARRAGLPLSDERVAMVSVTYNRGVGALRAHPVVDALQEGDRAEAWFQLRYNCWGLRPDMEGGLRKRRFAESEIFGLFKDHTDVPVEDAAKVYTMYRENRAEIERVERRFGVTIDGVEARPNRIAQANRDYPDIIAMYGPVSTISESLAPARSVLIGHLRTLYPDQSEEFTEGRFDAGEIDLDRYPIDRGQNVRERAFDTSLHDVASHAAREAAGSRFDEPFLNRLLEAVSAGDSASAGEITLAFAQSSRGEAFLEEGRQLLAQQQFETRESPEQSPAPDQIQAAARG